MSNDIRDGGHRAKIISEVVVDHFAVVTTAQEFQDSRVAVLGEETHRTIGKDKKSAAWMPTAECLRCASVDLCGEIVDPPHHIADHDRIQGKVASRHTSPKCGPFV